MHWDFFTASALIAGPDPTLGTDWARLNAESFANHPLTSMEFIGPLVHYFAGPDVSLARAEGPGAERSLILLQRGKSGIWTTFSPGQAPIGPALVVNPMQIAPLLSALPGFALGIDFMCQDPMHSRLVGLEPSARREQHRHVTTTAIELAGTFDEYWSDRNKKLRGNIKRYLKRLADRGKQVRLEVRTSPTDVLAGVDRYGLLESAGWKGQAGTALHPTNKQGHFYREMARNFSANHCSRVYELYFDDHLAASRLAVTNERMIVMLKTTYDETLSDLAPGRILLHLLLEREFNLRCHSRIEFYTNANADSIAWSTTTRDIYHVSQYRSGIIRGLITGTRQWRRNLRKSRSPQGPASSGEAESQDPG